MTSGSEELRAIAAKDAARPAARELALAARRLMIQSQRLLELVNDDAAASAITANDAITDVIEQTYDGPVEYFACERDRPR
jgi:hypothetical protein